MPETMYIDKRTGHGGFRLAHLPLRPHIVFITLDMVPPDVYRREEVNGGLVRTPNIDRLRAGGVSFTNAFCNSPLCGPSRASYLTGRYPYLLVNEERAHDGFAVSLRDDDIIFPEYLKASGYVAKHAGKSHVGAAKFTDAFGEIDVPWNRWAPPMTDDDGYVRYLKRLGVTPPVCRKPITGARSGGRTVGNNYGGFVTQGNASPFPEEAAYSHYLAGLVEERLDGALAQGVADGAPLYLQVDFFAPHQPFMIPSGLERRAGELRRKVKVPPGFARAASGGLAREPRIYEFYRRETGISDPAVIREYIVCNFLEMEVLDRAVGKVLSALETRGLLDGALVMLCADHGEMNGHRALVDKGAYAHPRVARVPLVVRPPCLHKAFAKSPSGVEVDTPVCLLDIAPTVLAAAGVTPLARLDGMSLMPFLRESASRNANYGAGRTFLFESFWHTGVNPAVALQWRPSPRRHFFYVYNLTSDSDELYDLNGTSYRNLARDRRYARVRRAMIRRLAAFLQSDTRWRCYWHTMRVDMEADLPPQAGDYQMFRPE